MTATDRAALTDALTAASAGPHPPPIARLRAAAEYVIDRARPDQVILFGSASRGEFSDGSDFDFFVVRRPAADARPTDNARWTHPETGDELDVLFETPELATERRWQLGTPHSVIFAEGATVHAAPGATPIRTLRDEGRTRADMTSPKSKWDPSEARNLVEGARFYLECADLGAARKVWGGACKQLQESSERALKSVIVASDSEFSNVHDLGTLWTRAEKVGEELPLERNDRSLTLISKYAGKAGYFEDPRGEDPEQLFRDFRPTAEALLVYAEKRVRARLAEYERTRKTDRPAR